MFKRMIVVSAAIITVCLTTPIALSAVPKLLMLEHFADYLT